MQRNVGLYLVEATFKVPKTVPDVISSIMGFVYLIFSYMGKVWTKSTTLFMVKTPSYIYSSIFVADFDITEDYRVQ